MNLSWIDKTLVLFAGAACCWSLSVAAHAATYYVRPDGGTASQCNGKADAPASAAPNCAWSAPTIALPQGSDNYGSTIPAALIQPGDTLHIAPGSYMVGYGAPGAAGAICGQSSPYECGIYSIPSGIDAEHPTVITGDCTKPPELWGTQRVNSIISLSNKHDITIQCLELTDHSSCIEFYQPDAARKCKRDSYPYGDWASGGIHADHVKNLTLKNLNVHGLANSGINAGALSGDTLLDGVTIRANGWVGFNGDLGGNNDQSSNSGTITIQNSSVEWNGCTEDYPKTTIVACWAQQAGGYGDGLGTARTGGDWRIINSRFIGNTSDGLDLLYADGTGSVLVDHVVSMWNAGNQIKVTAPATITNSVVVGMCDYFRGRGAMTDGDLCRAAGTAIAIDTVAGVTATLAHNTITGNGDCLVNGSPAGTYIYENNIFLGATYYRKGRPACLDWYSDGGRQPEVTWTHNIVWNVKGAKCPSGSICKDPRLQNEDLAHFDPALLPESPAIGAASAGCKASAPDTDGRQTCNIGAAEPPKALPSG